MNSLLKKYPSLFGRGFHQRHWLTLEIIAVLAIVIILAGLYLQQIPSYIYKTSFAQIFSAYPASARLMQQEEFAWTGQMKSKQKPLQEQDLYHSSIVPITDFWLDGNKTHFQIGPYKNIPKKQLILELKPEHNASLRLECHPETNIAASLLPFICKMRSHDNKY